MKTCILIVTRYNSTRLPGKCLFDINGVTTTDFLIQRLKYTALPIILCTGDNSDNEKYLKPIAERNGITFFVGSEEDMFQRVSDCIKKYSISNAVIVEGDDVLTCPDVINDIVNIRDKLNADIVKSVELPIGLNSIVVKTSIMDRLKSTTDTGWFNRIHNSPHIAVNYRLDRRYRLTMDYMEDYEVIKVIAEKCKANLTANGIVSYLDMHPEIDKINDYVKEEYWKTYNDNLRDNPGKEA